MHDVIFMYEPLPLPLQLFSVSIIQQITTDEHYVFVELPLSLLFGEDIYLT